MGYEHVVSRQASYDGNIKAENIHQITRDRTVVCDLIFAQIQGISIRRRKQRPFLIGILVRTEAIQTVGQILRKLLLT